MMNDYGTQREQILANARFMLVPSTTHTASKPTDLDVIVYGQTGSFTAAVMLGLTPAIQGPEANTPDSAMHKLLTATCELLNTFIPKLASHQRNIHGGGVFDDDLIRKELSSESHRKGAY
ncbi:hypothetical protein LTR56_025185 [Elasticomyces elasticus]|nr:hypothetical protein LTR56_025185 [Elasticomyces elasticus]KAK3649250.1 hypothetical protein LTR22_012979 [Elasticomyces elasticus]KAK4928216.1 hypothetical protein LTR49_005154 [Elasticomyces elasticus]KAK5765970.1 hypothetical protein LTS12_003977 [Elasticomyces elasticus]